MKTIKYVEDSYGHIHNITKEISRGGQGVVLRTQDNNIAIKLELDLKTQDAIDDDSKNMKFMEIRLLPIPQSLNITLPLATLKNKAGYVMALLDDMESFEKAFGTLKGVIDDNNFLKKISPSEYKELFKVYISSGGVRRRLKAYLKVAGILAQLHANGLVYCDFSPNNVFISSNQRYDNVWIIDADNINYKNKTANFYTPGFGAPEVVSGDANCSFYSDCHAFAVSLFKQLTFAQPFEGQAFDEALNNCEEREEIEKLRDCGEYAWIFDKDDDSNRSDNQQIPIDFIISRRLRELFQRTFCEDCRLNLGMEQLRPSMFQWAYYIALDYDNILRCSECGMDYITEDLHTKICPWNDCDTSAVLILRSYYIDKNSNRGECFWTYRHELINNIEIQIPLRVVEGFFVKDIDDIAFRILKDGDKISITKEETLNFNYSYSENGSDFLSYGIFNTTKGKFYIKCENNKTGSITLIEGEVV